MLFSLWLVFFTDAIVRSYCIVFGFECSIDKIWADWSGSIIRPV